LRVGRRRWNARWEGVRGGGCSEGRGARQGECGAGWAVSGVAACHDGCKAGDDEGAFSYSSHALVHFLVIYSMVVMLTYEESADADAASARWELARLLHQRVLHGVIPVNPCRSNQLVRKLNVRSRRRRGTRVTYPAGGTQTRLREKFRREVWRDAHIWTGRRR
jgi:hypothetical protein